MSRSTRFNRGWLIGLVLGAAFTFATVPAAAQASAVNLATASPFVALSGSTVTNTGPSVLNGDLGVAPGTSLVGFGLPAAVNGATHNNDAVAGQAQSDLTNAYNVAAEQPVAPANDLSGTDLGNRTLTAGAYRYTSSAQLTGALTLNAQGDPNAQFVFEIKSALTTAPASSVVLINGASPCNVYWQVGSSATLDTTTAFEGNLMALTSISLNNGASVNGRLLARNGQISLINNVLDGSQCGTGSTSASPPGPTAGGPGLAGGPTPGTVKVVPVSLPRKVSHQGHNGTATMHPTERAACTAGFRVTVRGRLIRKVVFSLDGTRIDSQSSSPFQVLVRAAPGAHKVGARVTFKDATPAKMLTFAYRACASAVLHPHHGPSKFTG